MKGAGVSLTLSSFATGRDVAIGIIHPAARYAARLETREVKASASIRLECETAIGAVPRRLSPASAIVAALFDERRRGSMVTEHIARLPMEREPLASLPLRIEDLINQLAIDARPDMTGGTGPDPVPPASDQRLPRLLRRSLS
jgi:hypothetical protein